MIGFDFITPAKIIFGQGRIKEIGAETKNLGKKALLVTGKSGLKKAGVLGKVEGYLKTAGIEVTPFYKVPPEPPIEVVDEGINFCTKEECDMVIGLGGGSALDVAKSVAYLRDNLPFIAIPTTAGTGSEASFNSVILYPEEQAKKSIRDPKMMASLAIIDPCLTISCPREVTIYCGLDTLVHLIEGFVSNRANPLTDSLALSGIRLVHQRLKRVVDHPQEVEAREEMSLAALMGGMVLANAGLGAVHGLAGSIGGKIDIPHGLVCAVLLPWIMEYNLNAAPEKFGRIARILDSESAVEGVQGLLADLGISPHLGSLGIEEKDLTAIVRDVSGSIRFNPREANEENLIALLKKAM